MDTYITFEHEPYKGTINLTNGQLISLTLHNKEYFHPGGADDYSGEGWKNSEIIPFPIFGPPKDFTVIANSKAYFLEQHGICRNTKENPFILTTKEDASITLLQQYDGRVLPNPKYVEGSHHPKEISWLPYTLEKTFTLTEEGLRCEFHLTNDANKTMPYMLGWHPAFSLLGPIKEGVFINEEANEHISLLEVIKQAPNTPKDTIRVKTTSVVYKNKQTGNGLRIQSKDFCDTMMLWSPSVEAKMFCIEQTTRLPFFTEEKHFEEEKKFETLASGESKKYVITIELF